MKSRSNTKTVVKNVVALLGGQFASKGLMIFYAAILARYLKSEGMGQIGTAMTLTGTVFVLVNLGLDTVITRDVARTRDQAGNYLMNAAAIKTTLALVATIVLLVVGGMGPYSPITRKLILLYCVGGLITALLGILRALFMAYEMMEYDVGLQVGRDVFNIVLSSIGILLKVSIVVLVGISVIASALQLILFSLLSWKLIALRSSVHLAQIKKLLVTALPFTAMAIVSVSYAQTSGLLLPILGSEREMGIYSAAMYVFSALQVIPGAFLQAIFPAFSRLSESNEKLTLVFEKSFRYITIAGVLIAIEIVLLAPLVIRLIFGTNFNLAVLPLQILGLVMICSGSWTSGGFLNATGHQNIYVITSVGFIVLQVAANVLCIPRWGAAGAAGAFSAVTMIAFAYYSGLCHRILRLRPNWKSGFLVLSIGIIVSLSAYGMRWLGLNAALVAVLVAFLYALLTFKLAILSRDELLSILNALGPRVSKFSARIFAR